MARRKTRRSHGEGAYWYDEKTKRHCYRISDQSGKRHNVADKDPERAKARFEELKRRLSDKIDIQGGRQTLHVFMTRYLETIVVNEVSQSTLHNYAKRAGYYILPTLGDYRLDELTTELGQAWVNAMVRNNWALSSIRQALSLVQRALDRAVGERLIPFNPFAVIKPPKAIRRHDDEEEEGRALSDDQVTALLNALKGQFLEPLYILAVRLGIRRGELLGLRWKDFDPEARTLSIRQQVIRLDKEIILTTSLKTKKSRRTLPLTDDLVALLQSHRVRVYELRLKAGSEWQDLDLIFPNEHGKWRRPDNLTMHFSRLCDRLKFGDFHFHDLRATAITRWRALGIDLEVAAALAGHSHVNVTANVYSEATEARKRAAIDKITGTE